MFLHQFKQTVFTLGKNQQTQSPESSSHSRDGGQGTGLRRGCGEAGWVGDGPTRDGLGPGAVLAVDPAVLALLSASDTLPGP